MRELLRVQRRLSLSLLEQRQPPLSSACELVRDGSSANIGRAFLETHRLLLLLLTSLTSNPFLLSMRDAMTVASLFAAIAALWTSALAVAPSMWLLVDTGVGVLMLISYAVWYLIFDVSALAVGFA